MSKRAPKHRRQLPLDDPRWLPIEKAQSRLERRTGHPDLAATDLLKWAKDGTVRGMRRDLKSGKRELVPPDSKYWAADGIYLHWPDKDGDWVFYVWDPDLKRLLGAESRTQDDDTLARNKPGRKATKNWKLLVASELLRAIAAGEGKPTGPSLAEFCHAKTGHLPEVTDVYKLVRDILRLL